MLSLSFLVLSLSGVATVSASFYGGTSVVELTGKTFDQVFADTNVWLVSGAAPVHRRRVI